MATKGFTSADAGWLSSSANASAFSEVTWRREGGSWRADIPVSAELFEEGDVDLVFQVNPRTAWMPSTVLRIRRDSRARICVNRPHREHGILIPPAPHWHTRRSSDHAEVYAPIEEPQFPDITVGDPVKHGRYRAVLQVLADAYNIDIHGVHWTDPPEEV